MTKKTWMSAMTWATDLARLPAGKTRRLAAGFAVSTVLTLTFSAAQTSAAQTSAAALTSAATSPGTAADYYVSARKAFRNGAYNDAVAAYHAADRAGFEDPALFYNLGVALYKLGRYPQAEAAFATASTSAKLAPLAYYNLGLVARKTADVYSARGWFQQAALHPAASANLQNLAARALETMPVASRRKPTAFQARETRLGDFLSFSFDSGFAYDSNIYRAPDASYVDLAATGTPTVIPTVQSGSFVPIEANAQFRWGTHEHSYFLVDYNFDGRFYTDSAYSNANAYRNEIALGGKAMIPTSNGYKYWHSRFTVARMEEQYYDRDDGQDQIFGTTDLSDRFRRTKWGPKAYYHRKRGGLGYGFRAEGFINDYANDFDQQFNYLDLTHEQYLAGVHASWYPWEKTELRVGYDWYRRLYAERKARSSNGIRFSTNDELEYDYANYTVILRQRAGRRWSATLDYKYTTRTDNFEGYDDYNRHTARGSLRYRARRFTAQAGFTWRTYDFPNAFTFNIAAAGEKSLDTTYADVEISYRLLPSFTIRMVAVRDIVDASDPRSEYTRNQIAVSLDWVP